LVPANLTVTSLSGAGDDVELPVVWTMPLIDVFILNALPLRASTPLD
jgi:hypothetical protein